MTDRLLVDTDILIDQLRGVQQAIDFLREERKRLTISVVTAAELYSGARDSELEQIRKLLRLFRRVPVSFQIARTGGLMRKKYHKSHRIEIADALIAATAQVKGIPLATLNRKHFPMMQVVTPYTKP